MVFVKNNIGGAGEGTVFNMAFATLIRLDGILQEINQIDSISSSDPIMAQSLKSNKIRSFFIQSSVLLPEPDVQKLRNNYLILQGKKTTISKMEGLGSSKQEIRRIYSPEYELELDNLLLDLLLLLQKNKVFMPSKADPKFGWKQ